MTESVERPWVLTFDGRTVPATPGESVGAALTNAGIRSWRVTRKQGRPRGLFCGIGVCFDCLLSIDGAPNLRACLTPVAPGMKLDSGSSTEQELTDA
jgi:predicted molibdopterin-dependent oxidoreductase YjgC